MITLYYHPLASYAWKALIALYELGTPFERRVVDLGDPADREQLASLWPLAKFPVLQTDEGVVAESTIVMEYLDRRSGGRTLFPDDETSLVVRTWDRLFDLYVQTPMQEVVLDRLLGSHGDTSGARRTLATAYEMAEARLASSEWMASERFSAADCAAAPALFYATTVQPFPGECVRLKAYFERLVARPSVLRTIEEARPYFELYPFEDAIDARFR